MVIHDVAAMVSWGEAIRVLIKPYEGEGEGEVKSMSIRVESFVGGLTKLARAARRASYIAGVGK